jgi:hypothetical protein
MTSYGCVSCAIDMRVGKTYVVHQLRVLPLALLISEHWLPEYPEMPQRSWYRV